MRRPWQPGPVLGFGTKRPLALPNLAVGCLSRRRLRRRWPGVSAGLCLGRPARRTPGHTPREPVQVRSLRKQVGVAAGRAFSTAERQARRGRRVPDRPPARAQHPAQTDAGRLVYLIFFYLLLPRWSFTRRVIVRLPRHLSKFQHLLALPSARAEPYGLPLWHAPSLLEVQNILEAASGQLDWAGSGSLCRDSACYSTGAKGRNTVERCFSKLRQHRAVATR
jgi:hypothetical protein